MAPEEPYDQPHGQPREGMEPGLNTQTGMTPPNRESVLADLVRLQALSRELNEACQQALDKRQGPRAPDLSEKAQESIRLVERLVDQATGQEPLERYRAATANLEDLLLRVSAASSQDDLEALRQTALTAVDEWASAVERVLEGVLSRARP